MGKRCRKKYYAVRAGRVPGIYHTWGECKAQTNGHSGSEFKGFLTEKDAETYMAAAKRSLEAPKHHDEQSEKKMRAVATINSHSISGVWKELDASEGNGGAYFEPRKADSLHHRVVQPKKKVPEVIIIDSDDETFPTTVPVTSATTSSGKNSIYSDFSQRMITQMGHIEGKGLGKNKNGITSPIAAKGTANSVHGIGWGTEELSSKQADALKAAQNSANVFITGVAGTGKSLVLHRIINDLKKRYEYGEWVAVGPTGTTSIAIEGQTIHSFAGIGIPKTYRDFEKAWKWKKRWRNLKALVLDEVSMISGEFFDCLSDVVSAIRGDPKPFGGIQLIICGDFLQLPPIPTKGSDVEEMKRAIANSTSNTSQKLFLNRGFAFQARNWKAAAFEVVMLDKVFRQQNSAFVDILSEIRKGRVSLEVMSFLKKCHRPLPPNNFGVRPTVLHSLNKDVAIENLLELNKLPDEMYRFDAIDSVEVEDGAPFSADRQLRNNHFFNSCRAEKLLQLKVGAQVMLVKNETHISRNGKSLVNGSRGRVIGFQKEEENDGIIGKLVANEEDLPGVDMYPVVQFLNGSKKLIKAQRFESRLVGLGCCIRVAIPLKLAWAVTMHKSQGLTLDYVIADVGRVFSEAQTYVALSRASDENGLELRNFSEQKVRANQCALSFYSNANSNFPHWETEQRMEYL